MSEVRDTEQGSRRVRDGGKKQKRRKPYAVKNAVRMECERSNEHRVRGEMRGAWVERARAAEQEGRGAGGQETLGLELHLRHELADTIGSGLVELALGLQDRDEARHRQHRAQLHSAAAPASVLVRSCCALPCRGRAAVRTITASVYVR
eukprot:3938318-Rhodomonas_salina.3